MGLLRDVALGVTRVALEAIAKAAEGDPPEQEDQGPPQDGAGGPPEDDSAHGDGPKDGPPPGPPPAPVRPTPEPVMGDGPTLAAPAADTDGAVQALGDLPARGQDPKSLFWDPFAIVDALGYKDRPSPITYTTLNNMVWRMPILQAIIQTRVKQVACFARPQVDKYTTGFRVAQRDRKAKPTPATEARSQQLERWLLTTGSTKNPAQRDNFSTFLQKIVRDSLIYDQMTFEVVPTNAGKPAEFYAVDAATVRIADTTRLFVDPEDAEAVRYVQIYDGLVIAEYTGAELCFGVRNPTTNIRNQQYGQSELEMLVATVTALLWAFDYNQRFFSQGTSAKGIINFKGAVPEKQLRSFRQHWYSMMAGVENAFRTPIVNADDMQFINMQQNNRDMEYNAWMDWLIKVTAAVYGMDPLEVNFKYGDSGGGKSMFESANESKLAASKDKGLRPLLEFLENKINGSLIWAQDEDFVFEFVGLESNSMSEQADLNTKLVKTCKTVNEVRAEEDMAPLPNGLGDIILDPVYMQHLTMAQQQQGQADAAAMGGPGAPPEFSADGAGPDGGEDSGEPPDGQPGPQDDTVDGSMPNVSAEPAPEEPPPEEAAAAEKSMYRLRAAARLVSAPSRVLPAGRSFPVPATALHKGLSSGRIVLEIDTKG